jgi:hypothetical protein
MDTENASAESPMPINKIVVMDKAKPYFLSCIFAMKTVSTILPNHRYCQVPYVAVIRGDTWQTGRRSNPEQLAEHLDAAQITFSMCTHLLMWYN